ncbi:FtsK/SpoIIIE domain-containing protein [Microlunatus soli]|uniref:DNA segregation ATPase FtsK/SpoIIIE, S-DNA-T family n=1 Tax=Microlunatus soli TaxID=630515 RepID=A0A1H1XCK5_9ACTN|nr:FtsK/SpoIIIE domain-containing protein [Microlunatus soli]SDT06781.1 DNA segregation ATPase FtsK/SpoIIIE, S-DNA-T family [Microlunatus soli]
MRLLIDINGARHEVELDRFAPSATLADLIIESSGEVPPDDAVLYVDDDPHPVDTPISSAVLLEGSVLAQTATVRARPIGGWSATLAGGLDAGRVVALPAERPLVIGRSPQADLTVDSVSTSWNHVSISREGDGARVRDAGSTNGTLVNGTKVGEDGVLVDDLAVIIAGGVVVLLRKDLGEDRAPEPGSLHNLTPAGTAPFNRPPRPGRPADPDSVEPPERKEIASATRFSIITVIAPLILAGAMVAIMGSPQYAMFAILSPIMGIGSWLEQKHRRAKNLKEEDERFGKAIDTFRDELQAAAADASRRSYIERPDPATVLRRAALPTTTMWQCRPAAKDFLVLHGGVGDVPWVPPVENRSGRKLEDKVRKTMQASRRPASAVEIDLSDAGVVGIVGNRAGALSLARSLLSQASIHCGPADLTIGVFCDAGRDEDWGWSSWLPQMRRHGGSSGDRWLSDNRGRSEEMLRSLRDSIDGHPTPAVLLVLDSDVLTEGRNAPARTLLGHGRGEQDRDRQKPLHKVSGIVVASSEDQLPAACTVVVTVGDDASATVTRPGDLTTVDDVVLAGISIETAYRGAMDLARFDDPELVVPGAALPSLVRLPPLLDLEDLSVEAVRRSWRESRGVSTPIGIGESGGFALDLVRDGPHGLVGGTTGSGKSEFLRSLVTGLAMRNDPTKLTFILIDFKGGAAFATCERLPHTIGTVSNLDEQLANRALRALEAEMEYRQRAFAAAGEGVDNLDEYLATNPAEPMPRLLLVVDEFAMLAKEYPDVLSSLVSVGAVGRTLGVHMILATQRPAGVVNDDILANTNMRVALRVQSRDDSMNVIGVPDASAISRQQQGRAYVKLGQDDITPVQTALVTGVSEQQTTTRLEVHPVSFGRIEKSATPQQQITSDETDLDRLIDAVVAANADAGLAPPRPVWPEPLGERVRLAGFESRPEQDESSDQDLEPVAELPVVGGVTDRMHVSFAISDDPDHQRQIPAGWDMDRGNLLMMGIPGSGTSTGLSTVALTLASAMSPDDLDIVILDMGSGDLAPLADLPHTTGYVKSGSGAREQQVRFLRYARAEVDRRKADPNGNRRVLVLVDGLAALREEFQDFEGMTLLEGLFRAYADGPDVGMSFAASTSRARMVPPAIDEVTTQKWLFRLADQYDYATAGLKPQDAPHAVAGRCVLAETKLQTHVATPDLGLAEAVAAVQQKWRGAHRKPDAVGQLPDNITVAELGAKAHVDGEPWLLPVGIREVDLEPQLLELYEGEHAMIAGPARSGKSTLLLSIAESIRTADPSIQIWGICDRRSPLGSSPLLDRVGVGADDVPAVLAAARIHTGRLVLLIDDAERFEDTDEAIANLLAAGLSGFFVIAAGRSDDLRSMYGHWTKTVQKSRCGVVLQPNVDFDGELIGVNLPRRAPVAMTPGRGYAGVAGSVALVQTSSPTPAT